MRIGIRAHDMENAPLEKLVQNISEKGFQCAQLALQKAIHTFNVSPEAMNPGMAFYIKEIFNRNNVDIAVLGCYLNLTNPVEQERNSIMDIYKTHIRFASLLGCGMVGTETGAMNREYSYEKANHSETALLTFIENLKVIIDYSEKMGVIIGIEPVYNHIVSDIERAYRVMASVNSPNLQIILDPVNLLTFNNFKDQEFIIKGAFELFSKDIAVIHLKDFKIEEEKIISTPIGTGLLNYELLLGILKKQKPFIHVLLEDTQPSNAVQSREFLEEIYRNISE
jgi:sugar phosphate isomerase/epimerase